ncbi:MAG: SDR family oxidoreductase [Tessaracoccus sp.]|uniref:SDR family NAD(P)-dependent oxidoreductase n=1 Tax=Tessaracoccus sp. TaxID=1971211 RepID=UPI001EB643CF|nr:SDR family oxidoreductase [Tessaracoccus sp.]MBK7822635.1 SDR family oxidoreductase [Tessaracoccus sp.]
MSTSWAVITGASAGLGVAYADRLASEGANVWLAARSGDVLEDVAAGIRERHGVQTRVTAVDLSADATRRGFVEEVGAAQISHLINNAGFGTMGDFVDADPARLGQEMQLNMVALTELTRAVLPGMKERGRGAVVNVASTAAFQPIPTMAVYAASKAYVLRFSVALRDELKGTGVRVLAICPGPTETAFFANAGNESAMSNRRTPQQVVDTTFEALKRNRPFVVDGATNATLAFANRLAPTWLAVSLARRIATH